MSASYMVCPTCEQEVTLFERYEDDEDAVWQCDACEKNVEPVHVDCDMSDEQIEAACKAAREAA